MGDGEQLVASLALRVHPLPQVLRVPGIEGAIGHLRHMRALAEEDITVQVYVVALGCIFVRTESGELAGMVVRIGNLDILLPDRARYLGAHEGFHWRRAGQA